MNSEKSDRSRFWSHLAFGIKLARRGILPGISIGLGLLITVACAVVAGVLAARGPLSTAHHVPLLASGILAWGAGFFLAFSVAAHALVRDRAEGVRGLFVTRTLSLRGYLMARMGGLVALLVMMVAGGTLACGLVAAAVATDRVLVFRVLHATLAAIVFSVAFSAVVAPVAFAALGARSRLGGYFFLLCVVMVPELIVSLVDSVVPESLADVLSIPSALSALRSSLAPGSTDFARALRAVVALSLVSVIAMSFVRRDARWLDRPEGDA